MPVGTSSRALENNNMIILALPLEIVSYIFRFLQASDLKCAALVCCQWSKASQDPILWRNVSVSLGTRRERFSHLLVDSLQRRCIQYLRFKHTTTAAQILQVCKQVGSNLKVLSLQGCRCVNDNLLEVLSKYCPNLVRLDLSRCRQLDVAKNGIWLDKCADVWRQLTVLDLNACKDISDVLVLKVADLMPNLVDFSISGCKGIGISTWHKMAKKLSSLKHLDISRSDVTDEVMLKFSQIPELRLKEINLTACKHLTDNGVVSLVKYQTSLEVVKLACVDITNTTLICIGKYIHSLRVLDLNSCRQLTDGALLTVNALLINLHSLNFYSCYQLSNSGLTKFLCWTQGTNHNVPLKVLVLNGCSSLSDELVLRFSTVLINLQELDLSSCLRVTDIGLSAITSSLIKLQSLRLSWCINITDSGLGGFVPAEQNLAHVHQSEKFKKGGKDTQSQVPKGIKNLEQLKLLDISHCTCITDEGLRSICQLKNLTTLNINMCTQVECMVT
ncbi:F-box/LRR-repeat protein 14 [Stylophora pistillata]|uniref:F-box/LRR-repeat protein 14 n=1 Tax=Stylophora pistillata TaxID=50429 RepID=A0A2B4RSJ3_STYPI|nr:F-box/LRR-repeat protein 14 [Stylophora pistillata]